MDWSRLGGKTLYSLKQAKLHNTYNIEAPDPPLASPSITPMHMMYEGIIASKVGPNQCMTRGGGGIRWGHTKGFQEISVHCTQTVNSVHVHCNNSTL